MGNCKAKIILFIFLSFSVNSAIIIEPMINILFKYYHLFASHLSVLLSDTFPALLCVGGSTIS